MSYKPISLITLISRKNKDLYLPHIQRPFVWEYDQIIKLMDSLMRNYPVQTLLFWKTNEYIKTRKFMDNIKINPDLSDYYDIAMSQDGKVKTFVLDGQQRLQSLFAVFDGYYEGDEFYINILSGTRELDDGMYYEFALAEPGQHIDNHFIKLKSLLNDNRNSEDIADVSNDLFDSTIKNEENKKERQRLVRHNISQLLSIIREDKYFWIDELDGIAKKYSYSEILNIFVRVNSGGTKLDAANLMFAAMKEAWEDIEQNIEDIVDMLNNSGRLNFDKTFVLKCIMTIIGKGSILSPNLFMGNVGDHNIELIKANWVSADGKTGIEETFKELRDFIEIELKIYSDKIIRSYNAFIPIFEYLYFHSKPDTINRKKIKSYYYRAQLFNWFSARTDQLINSVHNILMKTAIKDFPLDNIVDYFSGQKKEVLFQNKHLEENRLRYILLNMIYVEYHGTSPFNVAFKGNEPHIDHIYPKSKLKHLPTGQVNHVGNYRLVGASDNIKKRAELPDSYFDGLQKTGLDIKRHLLVDYYASNTKELTIANYIDFRDKRLEVMLGIISGIVNC